MFVLVSFQTVRAYLLKEDFQQFWQYNLPRWAGMFLDFWCYQTMRSRIEPMKKIARKGDNEVDPRVLLQGWFSHEGREEQVAVKRATSSYRLMAFDNGLVRRSRG